MSGAIQSIAQLESTDGILGAQTLLSTFSSKIIFREGSFKDAEYWSNELGQREIIEESKTLSDSGLTTAQAKKVVQTVMPSEFSGLPDLVAYCRFPGMEDIHRIEFEIRKYKSIRPAFLPPGEPEPEQEFSDPKVAEQKKEETTKEDPFHMPIFPIVGLVALGLAGWFAVSQMTGHNPPVPLSSPSVIHEKPKPESRVFHWTNGTFRCRIDHSNSTGKRPWNCVRVGSPRLPITKKHSAGIPAGKPVDPIMSLPIWTGPWPTWWHCLPKNAGKWVVVNRLIRDRYGNFVYRLVDKTAEQMRVRCPK